MLEYSHDALLIAASLAVALMSGFTGLSLTRGASSLGLAQRKFVVALSAVALGGGIWSMHFVAMLGLELPILFYYDALITLMSALVAILMAGVALLLLHFGRRTRSRIVLAGLIVGLGIPVMHYIGMSGMQLCRPVYSPGGVVLALAASIALSITAFRVAYGRRGARNILLGTVAFGAAVFTVHFVAMAGTGFERIEQAGSPGPWMSNDMLAFGVTLSVFVISGAFLLTGVTFAPTAPAAQPDRDADPEPAPGWVAPVRIPYEQNGRIQFIGHDEVAAIRAEGHYTLLYAGADKLFCPWSISEIEQKLPADSFLRTHRSYLVNRHRVSGFERRKDNGICYFEGLGALSRVPVSRSRLHDVRAALGV